MAQYSNFVLRACNYRNEEADPSYKVKRYNWKLIKLIMVKLCASKAFILYIFV